MCKAKFRTGQVGSLQNEKQMHASVYSQNQETNETFNATVKST